MALPHITLTGNLTNDPELRHTQTGKAVVNLRVACSDRKKNEAGEWVDGDTTFIDVTAWWRAEAIGAQLHKGNQVQITGSLKQREYEKDGVKRVVHEVVAETVSLVIRDENYQASSRPATQASAPVQAADPNPWATAGLIAEEDTPF